MLWELRGQGRGFICRDTNAMTQSTALNALAQTASWDDWRCILTCTHTGNQVCRQPAAYLHKQRRGEVCLGSLEIPKYSRKYTFSWRGNPALGRPRCLWCLQRYQDDGSFSSEHMEHKNIISPMVPFSKALSSLHQCKIPSFVWNTGILRNIDTPSLYLHTREVLQGVWECCSCRPNDDKLQRDRLSLFSPRSDINRPPEQNSDDPFNGSILVNFTDKTCSGMWAKTLKTTSVPSFSFVPFVILWLGSEPGPCSKQLMSRPRQWETNSKTIAWPPLSVNAKWV